MVSVVLAHHRLSENIDGLFLAFYVTLTSDEN